jgi:hypothetical protein
MRDLYGEEGGRVANAVLRGRFPADLMRYPLCEDLVERSRLVLVHNYHAASILRDRVPGAKIEVIPMGIPLPALVAQDVARQALGLPASAFVVASITHVNPNKRLPVVLRAVRQAIARFPEMLLVVAGTMTDEMRRLLLREVSFLGLERHVVFWGYVSDDRARLLARAADACVNLRYPSTGETSASLLRLLGAGKPVIVSDTAMDDLPGGVSLRVPVDRFEAENLAALLTALAEDGRYREDAGDVARSYIEEHHLMVREIDGYRSAVESAYGLELPLVDAEVQEPAPVLSRVEQPRRLAKRSSSVARDIAGALERTGIHGDTLTVKVVAERMVDLGLDQMPRERTYDGDQSQVAERLASKLACPLCHARLVSSPEAYGCPTCGRKFNVESGIPTFS